MSRNNRRHFSNAIVTFISFLLGTIEAGAASVRFSVAEVTAAQSQAEVGSGILTARLRSEPLTAESPTEMIFELPVPGAKTADMEPGAWIFEVRVKGFWAAPKLSQIAEGENQVQFKLWPAGTLQARLAAGYNNEEPPSKIVVHFEPAPTTGRAAAEPNGSVVCPMAEDRWTCEVPAAHLDLRLAAEGYISQYRWGVDVLVDRPLDFGILEFRRGASVLGWIETETGESAEGTLVVLRPGSMDHHRDSTARERLKRLRMSAKTNHRGFFHIPGVNPGEYVVEASKEPFSPARATVRVLQDQETLISNPPLILREPQRFEMYVEPAVHPSGEPWLIKMVQLDRGSKVMAVFDETAVEPSGFWSRMGLPPGRYSLVVRTADGAQWFGQELKIESNPPPLFIDLPIIEINGVIFWGDGALRAEVRFRKMSASVTFHSDAEGRFGGLLPQPGMWEVAVVGVDTEVRRSFQQIKVVKKSGKPYAEVEIRVPDTRIEGVVVDSDGMPVQGAIVTVQSVEKIVRDVRTQTNAEGEFRVYGLPPGVVTVVAEDSVAGHLLYSDEATVVLENSAKTRHVRLVLQPEKKIRGRVIAGSQGVSGARIVATPCCMHSLLVPTETSDAMGYFEIHLPSSTQEFFLEIAAPGFGYQFQRLRADVEQPLIIPVTGASGTLVVDLPDSTNPELWDSPKAYLLHKGGIQALSLLLAWARFHGQVQQDDNSFVVPNMEPGDYSACLIHPSKLFTLLGGPRPGTECVSGYLPASGELLLSLGGLAAD
ncbi:MAG: carboxypeptidase regulatory-like domain-containing protein [bacterium]|nr:carboxypeptidase regulatory-like domain-containing protein [bacterium]